MLHRNGQKLASGDRAAEAASLLEAYRRLDAAYGGVTWHWMPEYVHGPFDVIAGAILVQHTNWTNAERALDALRSAGALEPSTILAMSEDELAVLVRVSGTPTIKARRLKAVASTIRDAGGLEAMLALPPAELRVRLIATQGIGPETADAILLYAAGHPAFVVDAYTRRLFRRIGVGPRCDGYDDWQQFLHMRLRGDARCYQRYHAYIVLHGKAVCGAVPRCAECMLVDSCNRGREELPAAYSTVVTQ